MILACLTYKVSALQGCDITSIAVKTQFEPMGEDPDVVKLNIIIYASLENEYVPYIEQFNRILKKQYRTCFSTQPFITIHC